MVRAASQTCSSVFCCTPARSPTHTPPPHLPPCSHPESPHPSPPHSPFHLLAFLLTHLLTLFLTFSLLLNHLFILLFTLLTCHPTCLLALLLNLLLSSLLASFSLCSSHPHFPSHSLCCFTSCSLHANPMVSLPSLKQPHFHSRPLCRLFPLPDSLFSYVSVSHSPSFLHSFTQKLPSQ